VKNIFAGFWADESAATAIEYGLIAAGIDLAIVAASMVLVPTSIQGFHPSIRH
jgi:Flp pilus assembly pilin Flp